MPVGKKPTRKFEPGEDLEEAAAREAKEELGITVLAGQKLSSFVAGNFLLTTYEVYSVLLDLTARFCWDGSKC